MTGTQDPKRNDIEHKHLEHRARSTDSPIQDEIDTEERIEKCNHLQIIGTETCSFRFRDEKPNTIVCKQDNQKRQNEHDNQIIDEAVKCDTGAPDPICPLRYFVLPYY